MRIIYRTVAALILLIAPAAPVAPIAQAAQTARFSNEVAGPAVGGEFQINTYTLGQQYGVGAAASAGGEFVIVWASEGSDGSDQSAYSVLGQRYASNGARQGGEFQVNVYTLDDQDEPAVAMAPDGDFVVVWASEGSYATDLDGDSIQAQRYDSGGTPLGDQFQVNSYTTGDQDLPAVAIGAGGDFVVAWISTGSYGSDRSSKSIQAQRFDAGGTPLGGQFQVNSYTTSSQGAPSVGATPGGDFVVVWHSAGSDGSDTDAASVQGQRFASNGAPLGGEFQVNAYTTDYQLLPAVAVDTEGNFVVVWQSNGSTGSDTDFSSIQGRRYEADGTPLGGEFQVNSYTTSFQREPAVAVGPEGEFVVTWFSSGSAGSDDEGQSVQARRYRSDGLPVAEEFQVNSYTTGDQSRPVVARAPNGNFVVAWESPGSFGTDTSSYSVNGQRFEPTIFADGFESGDMSAWSVVVP